MSQRLRRILPLAGVAATGLVAVSVFLGGGGAAEDSVPPASAAPSPPVVGLTTSSVLDPIGVRSAVPRAASVTASEPPEVAAVRFLELTEEVVQLSPEAGAQAQHSISSEASADQLAGEVFDLLTQVANDVPDGVIIHIAPIGVRSTETRSGWDISIWYVEVIVYGDDLAVEQWRTATYSLVEEDGSWRMDALDSTEGPVPTHPAATVAWSTLAFIGEVSDLDDEVLVP